jgi:hypothetical protein
MKKSQIYKIANVISEDPDVFYEENESHLSLIYTNIYDETKEVTIRRAWAGRGPYIGGAQQAPTFYLVEWAGRSDSGRRIGVLTVEGLERESLARIQAIAQPNTQYWIYRRGLKRDQKKKRQWKKSIETWNYMRAQYGRCCPSWHEETHVDNGNNCRRAKYPDVGATPGAVVKPRTSEPEVAPVRTLQPRYQTDYGLLQVIPKTREPGAETWAVSLQGEDPKVMNYDEIVKYLQDEGIRP